MSTKRPTKSYVALLVRLERSSLDCILTPPRESVMLANSIANIFADRKVTTWLAAKIESERVLPEHACTRLVWSFKISPVWRMLIFLNSCADW